MQGSAEIPPKIRACLFDMDGLLINSEDLISKCINDILFECGRPPLPWSIKAQVQGRTLAEANRIFHEWAQLPMPHDEYQRRLRDYQIKYFPTCKPLLGVEELLAKLNRADDVEIALATSSTRDKFELKTNHLEDIFEVFARSRRVLGDDGRIAAGRHKPMPDVWLLALESINDTLPKEKQIIQPKECLVFEDAILGVQSARRAGMQVVWVPHPGLLKDLSEGVLDDVLHGLITEPDGTAVIAASTNRLWAKVLPSLEEFPYETYGIET